MSDDINPLYGDYKQPAAQEVEPSAQAAEPDELTTCICGKRMWRHYSPASKAGPERYYYKCESCGSMCDDYPVAASGQAGAEWPRYGDIAHKIVQAIYEKKQAIPNTAIVEQILMDSFPVSAPASQPSAELEKLRNDGWMVAVHNDYWIGAPKQRKTFWLLTRGGREGAFVKGEGDTDADAISQITRQLESHSAALSAPKAPAGQPDKIEQEMAGLRFRIHNLEGHNQYFFRCESAWCHPADKQFQNPALETFKEAVKLREAPAPAPLDLEKVAKEIDKLADKWFHANREFSRSVRAILELDEIEFLNIAPFMAECPYTGHWANAWRSGWERAVAHCNAELIKRAIQADEPASPPTKENP